MGLMALGNVRLVVTKESVYSRLTTPDLRLTTPDLRLTTFDYSAAIYARTRVIARAWSCQTRDSETSSTSLISRSVSERS